MNRTRKRKRKRSAQHLRPDYNALEPRQLLAAVINGGVGDDILDVAYVGDNTVRYLLNGVPAKVDVTDGLNINLLGGSDRVSLDTSIKANVQVLFAEEIVASDGDNQWNVGFVEPAKDGRFIAAGRINRNIVFLGANRLVGGNDTDTFTINAKHSQSHLRVDGGGGDDLFWFSTGSSIAIGIPSVSAFGDDGNDRFVYFGTANASPQGGDGYDVVDYRNATYQIGLTYGDPIIGNEKVIAPIGLGGSLKAPSTKGDNSSFDWVIDGNRTTLLEINTGWSVELVNFTEFEGASYGFDRFWVLKTAQDIEITDADWIQISSDLDASNGNLDTINHDLAIVRSGHSTVRIGDVIHTFYDEDGVSFNPRVVISDITSDGTHGIFAQGNKIIGLTGGSIQFRDKFREWNYDIQPDNTGVDLTPSPDIPGVPVFDHFKPEIIVHGSRTGDDIFVLESTWSPTKIYSHGGNDTFMIGSTNANANGDLRSIGGELDLFAGVGLDRMYVNNQGFDAYSLTYDLTPTGVQDTWRFSQGSRPQDQPYFLSPNAFSRIGFNSALEVARVNGSATTASKFYISPSTATKFVVDGLRQQSENDRLQIVGPVSGNLYKANDIGSWQFDGGYQPVHFYGVEETPDIQ